MYNSGISFTGIRNVGGINTTVVDLQSMKLLDRNYLTVQLADDYYGNDLTQFKNVVKKCQPDLGRCVCDINNSFVNIFTSKKYDSDEIPQLYVNLKKVPLTKKHCRCFLISQN